MGIVGEQDNDRRDGGRLAAVPPARAGAGRLLVALEVVADPLVEAPEGDRHAAAVVVSVGDGVVGWAVGDRVTLGTDGGDAAGDDCEPMVDQAELPCRVQDPELWFAGSPEDLERAKAFCRGCPVRAACLGGALERREPWGVWGGEIFQRGRVIARKLPPGRPPRTGRTAMAPTARGRRPDRPPARG